MFRRVLLSLLLVAFLAHAQDRVPLQLSLVVMLKLVTYDSGFAAQGSGPFVVAIPHSAAQSKALEEALREAAEIKVRSVQSRELKFVPVADAAALAALKPSAVLVLPGTTDAQLEGLLTVAAAQHLYTLAVDPSDVSRKVLLGVDAHDGKPQPLLGLSASKAAGVVMPSSVLKIVRAVQ